MIQVRTVFGAHQITVVEPSQQERIVPLSAITIHPEWDRGTLRNDVAVLFIAQAVTLNSESYNFILQIITTVKSFLFILIYRLRPTNPFNTS